MPSGSLSSSDEGNNKIGSDEKERRRNKTSWSTKEDETLLMVLWEQKKLGNQAESGRKPTVWTAVATALEKNHPATKYLRRMQSSVYPVL